MQARHNMLTLHLSGEKAVVGHEARVHEQLLQGRSQARLISPAPPAELDECEGEDGAGFCPDHGWVLGGSAYWVLLWRAGVHR